MTEPERRSAERRKVFLAAEIETPEGRVRSSVARDASASGLLLLTRGAIEVGAELRLHVLRLDPDAEKITVTGRVVRCDPLDDDEALLWTRKLGIHLADPPPELFVEIERFAEKQRALYGA